MSLNKAIQRNKYPLRRGLLIGALCVCLPLQVSAASVEERLAKVERLVQSQGLIQLMNQVDKLQLELQKLRGEIEFQTHTLDQIKQRQRELYLDADRRLKSLETGGASASVASPASPGTELPASSADNPPLPILSGSAAVDHPLLTEESRSAPLSLELSVPQAAPAASPAPAVAGLPTETVVSSANPQAVATTETIVLANQAPAATADPALAEQAYKQAFNLLKTGQHEQAMKEFASFVEDYPASSYAPNAQYWLGEAYYVKQRFNEAIAEFRLLVQNYPNSQKLTHSLLKIGYSLHELKQYDEAIKVLQDLQTRYPGTSAARYAAERLEAVKADKLAAPAAKAKPQG